MLKRVLFLKSWITLGSCVCSVVCALAQDNQVVDLSLTVRHGGVTGKIAKVGTSIIQSTRPAQVWQVRRPFFSRYNA